MSIPSDVEKLIDRFHRNLKTYMDSSYKETRVRVEFIDPFFEALGWDVRNVQGYAEQYKDVVHEASITIKGKAKAPDYSFRIGGVKKFYLEAKKPAVSIKSQSNPAYQVRRYAWTEKLPLSILTDFEEFAVFDCRIPPHEKDKPNTARILYLTYNEYVARWDEINSIFSKEAVLMGSFDKYVMSSKHKRGTSEVDVEILKEIESWRESLARNIALRNISLSVHELNYAVQCTIDRILFLRMCEDRGIEDYKNLYRILDHPNIYNSLLKLYSRADDKYNSGLFDFKADTLSYTLRIDDRVLKGIIDGLYYPQCPYEFSVLPSVVLGQVYEQFLGKVIRLTTGHRAKVEEKPEVKKAGGVYYTPSYIVDYIVKKTVGKLIKGKSPGQIRKIHIVDPACGSGSFLLGAYQFLLDHHLQWYQTHDPAKHSLKKTPPICQDSLREWRLTTTEKKQILLSSIYGVDIDRQAVEVTKLSLLLKVLEGENKESLGQQLNIWQERALPDLENNIKCGNSLIAPDYFKEQLLPDEEEMRKINPFNWCIEFSQIIDSGGFDAVIGNPPYVRQETLKNQKRYLKDYYQVYNGVADLYVYFIEKSLNLLNSYGLYGIIVSNKWMRANYGDALRKLLASSFQVTEIVDFGELPVFRGVGTFPAIIFIKQRQGKIQNFSYAPISELIPNLLETHVAQRKYEVDVSEGWNLLPLETANLLKKLNDTRKPRGIGITLGDYVEGKIYYGIKTGYNEAFVINSETRYRLISDNPRCDELIKPFLRGRDIRRYAHPLSEQYIIIIPKGWTATQAGNIKNAWLWMQENYPKLSKHLKQYEGKAKNRCDQGDFWWELRGCDYYSEFSRPKILFPDICKESRFSFDRDGLYATNTVYFIPLDDLYLLGILGSALTWFYLMNVCTVLGDTNKGGRLRLFRQFLERIPIHIVNVDDPNDSAIYDRITSLVENMLELNKMLSSTSISSERNFYERQIENTDKQIDSIVYKLYDLTAGEIAIVEETVQHNKRK